MVSFRYLLPFLVACSVSEAIDIHVLNTNDSGAGSFREAITTINQNTSASTYDVIFDVGGTINLASPLPPINYPGVAHVVTINQTTPQAVTINGGGLYRAFAVLAGTVTIQEITVNGAKAQGGAGGSGGVSGGGGAGGGLGGGLFVNSTAAVTIQDVEFTNCSAVGGTGGTGGTSMGGGGGGGAGGGAGGVGTTSGGGGGGFFGTGGALPNGGGGGGGMFGNGGVPTGGSPDPWGGSGGGGANSGQNGGVGTSTVTTSTGGLGGGTSGGAGGAAGVNGSPGGNFSGGGGGGANGGGIAGSGGLGGVGGGGGGAGRAAGGTGGVGGGGGVCGGGGGGGASGNIAAQAGGPGGFFGGGGGGGQQFNGGAGNGVGGAGGYSGGGGGGGRRGNGGTGGFGAGGGGGGHIQTTNGGNFGTGGGSGGGGGSTGGGGGGGGAAFGGAVFVRSGGSLTINDSPGISGNAVTAGTGGAGSGNGMAGGTGTAAGTDFYLNGGTTTVFNITAGTLSVNGTVAGDTSGVGTLTKTGAGVLQFAGVNTYRAGNTISAGTLAINSDSALGNASNTLDIGSATLRFDTSFTASRTANLTGTSFFNSDVNTVTYAGAIDGGGSLNKSGTGTLILTGAKTYSGGTHVVVGTLRGDTVSLHGGIVNDSILAFDQTIDGTFSSNITGSGNLIKTNAGQLILTGANSQSAGMDVTDGSVLVNGTFTGDVLVASLGLLGGTGTITGNVSNSGAIAPGASIGTTSVVGNVAFNSGSTFEVEFSCVNADLLNVTGSVSIAGGAGIILFPQTSMCNPKQQVVIHTTGGLSGMFSTVNVMPPLVSVELIYTSTDLILLLGFRPFSDLVSKGNAGIVARYLDKQTFISGTDLGCVITTLRLMYNPEDLYNALEQLHPALYSGFTLLQENIVIRLNDFFNDRVSSCSGPWFAFLGDIEKQNAVKDYIRDGYRSASEGFVLGWDKRFSDGAYLTGAAFTFVHNDISWGRSIAEGSKWDLFLTLYGSVFDALDLSILGGYGHVDATRYIKFASVDRSAKHTHDSWMWDIHGALYWPLEWNRFVFHPYFELDFVNEYQSSFTESGADSIDLHVQSRYSNLLRPELGVDLIWKDFLRIALGYVYEARFSGKHITAKMEGAVGYFTVIGLNPNRSLFAYDIALMKKSLKSDSSIVLDYGGEVGGGLIDQHITLKAKYCF